MLNGFAATAKGAYLDKKVAEQGLTRKAATYAMGTVTVSGNVGSVISSGDKVASDTLVFTVAQSKYIDSSGTATVSVSCDTPGKQGNVPIGAISRFPVTIGGLTSVTNPSATTGGFDVENDDELRDRYFEKVSLPATSGSKYHYVMWAKEVEGVGDAKCIPLWNGAGTVKVIIINAEKQAADATLITAVTEHIEAERPIGAAVTVESAQPLTVDVNVSLVLIAGSTVDSAREKIRANITKYLQKNAFAAEYISYAQIGGCILSCEEVLDYSDLLVNGGNENIEVSETEVPVLGVVDLA
ncbi:MAG: baseplate J/gp47 family protein [Bacillota bacterium]|nr:baseplate J/gp47 family protein [Bacillota bacterium]